LGGKEYEKNKKEYKKKEQERERKKRKDVCAKEELYVAKTKTENRSRHPKKKIEIENGTRAAPMHPGRTSDSAITVVKR
jgi:hypothetical protein